MNTYLDNNPLPWARHCAVEVAKWGGGVGRTRDLLYAYRVQIEGTGFIDASWRVSLTLKENHNHFIEYISVLTILSIMVLHPPLNWGPIDTYIYNCVSSMSPTHSWTRLPKQCAIPPNGLQLWSRQAAQEKSRFLSACRLQLPPCLFRRSARIFPTLASRQPLRSHESRLWRNTWMGRRCQPSSSPRRNQSSSLQRQSR